MEALLLLLDLEYPYWHYLDLVDGYLGVLPGPPDRQLVEHPQPLLFGR